MPSIGNSYSKYLLKVKFFNILFQNESHTNEVYLDDDTFYEPEPKIETPTKRKPSYVAHTPLLKMPKKEPVTEKEDSIELFGKYIVSLLKKLPKISSNRLQYEFVKQIFEAQHEKTVSEGTMTDDDNSGTNNRLTNSQNTCYKDGAVTVNTM